MEYLVNYWAFFFNRYSICICDNPKYNGLF